MIRILLVLCLAASLPFLAAGSSKAKRLNRIEDRLARIETRQDHDSISHREDIADLALRVDDVETLVNSSAAMCQTGYASSSLDEPSTEDGLKELVANGMLVMQTAIAEVKARSHNDVSEIQTTIAELTTDVDAAIDDVKTEVNKAKTDVKQELNTAKKQSDTSFKEMQDKLDNMEKLITDMQSKQSACIKEIVDTQSPQTSTPHTVVTQSTQHPIKQTYSSCLELYRNGVQQSGTYDIHPAPGNASIKVFCDMETDGGGWTVFQRRQDGSIDFYLKWDEYALGFGDLEGEFWLGNDYISSLTSECCHELRVDLWDFEGNSAFAKYKQFQVLSSKDNYRLEVSGYSGNASDSLATEHSGMEFSTKDRDNDVYSSGHCAKTCSGAWWYSQCHLSNLNSLYLHGPDGDWTRGLVWRGWKGREYSLKKTELKFRQI